MRLMFQNEAQSLMTEWICPCLLNFVILKESKTLGIHAMLYVGFYNDR